MKMKDFKKYLKEKGPEYYAEQIKKNMLTAEEFFDMYINGELEILDAKLAYSDHEKIVYDVKAQITHPVNYVFITANFNPEDVE